MKLTIDIPDQYVKILSKWASVARTLHESERIINECLPPSILSEVKEDQISNNLEELNDIIPALDNLHSTVRSAIWEEEKILNTGKKENRIIIGLKEAIEHTKGNDSVATLHVLNIKNKEMKVGDLVIKTNPHSSEWVGPAKIHSFYNDKDYFKLIFLNANSTKTCAKKNFRLLTTEERDVFLRAFEYHSLIFGDFK
jgi:hypothetical protein